MENIQNCKFQFIRSSPTVFSVLLILFWRKKMLIFVCSIAFLVGIWAWAIFYTAFNSRHPNESKQIISLNFDSYPDHLVGRYVKNSQIVKYQKTVQVNKNSDAPEESMKIGGKVKFNSIFHYFTLPYLPSLVPCVCVCCVYVHQNVFNDSNHFS